LNPLSKFACDSPVCHPLYGLGTVETIEEKTVLGEKIALAQIFFPNENLKMMVNVAKETELFRPVISKEEVGEVFEYLESHEVENMTRANQRQRMHLEKIKSNNIFRLCEVIKDLALMSQRKKLSFKEAEMYERAKRVLVEELALVTGGQKEALDEKVLAACFSAN
jgi:CarD family transcriptional regulator